MEFSSAIQQLNRRGRLTDADARDTLDSFLASELDVMDTRPVLREGMRLAGLLNHSDTFDTTGYALAQSLVPLHILVNCAATPGGLVRADQ